MTCTSVRLRSVVPTVPHSIVPVAVKITRPPPGPEIPPPPPGPIGTLRVTVTTSGPVPTVQYLVTVNPCDPDLRSAPAGMSTRPESCPSS